MTARFLPVETGIRDGEAIEITSGLRDGAEVITTGAGGLKDGDRIVPASTQQQTRRRPRRRELRAAAATAGEHAMSIPRTAIERPVTMFMICGVIMLLGLMSLARLPVDLMPDVSYPSLTVRVGYPGVGPLEMEELVTRPIEQAVSATSGVERLESTSAEGSSRVYAELRLGHRPERSGR